MADYISREAAYKTLTEYYHHSSGVQHTVLREVINRVPTADVRPVVRGSWKDVPFGWECTACHKKNEYSVLFNFCPNCGADMREVKSDE